MHEGASWSGHERNCCFLNLHDGTFLDVSAAAGLDFLDDGRALAVTDWDGDGDLDVWLKNRTGPQLRFMRNSGTPHHTFISLRLQGVACNRDGIGAKVVVEAGGQRLVRTTVAGDGYLSQSSPWLHFGLGTADRVDSVTVYWPGGEAQSVSGLELNKRYLLLQGRAGVQPVESRRENLSELPGDTGDTPGMARVVLKAPLPLPPSVMGELHGDDRLNGPILVNLWAHWCAPCLAELSEFLAQSERIDAAGLGIIALNVDKPKDRNAARAVFAERFEPRTAAEALRNVMPTEGMMDTISALLTHVRGGPNDWPLPASLMVDADGQLQLVYLGPVGVDQLLSDLNDYCLSTRPAHLRSTFAGRWYYRTPRDLGGLADELKKLGREKDAEYYEKLSLQEKVRRRGRP